LRRLGTVAQKNLGVQPDEGPLSGGDNAGENGAPIKPVKFQRFRLKDSDPE